MTAPFWGLIFAAASTTLLWLVSLRTRDVSIIDIFWGPGIAGVVDIAAALGHAGGERASTALFLVNLWGLRLAAHIWARHKGEDHRYAVMRQQFGSQWWWLSLIQAFLLQAILIWFIASPLVAAVLSSRAPMGWLDYAGTALAAGGLMFEAVADFQLGAFRSDPGNKGKVLDRGLWNLSRHPNYFGECVMWWGYFLLGFAAAHRWWLVLSPLTVTILLLKVSGVSLMEDKIDTRRPDYAAYKKRVSAFVPWLSRR
jgi:steroid 5-alpha reductase family enzyme